MIRRPPGDVAWAELARALGLRPHMVCTPYREGDGIKQLRARIGRPVDDPGPSDWLCGTYEGGAVVVASYIRKGRASDFAVNTTSQGNATYTAVVMELDPPLLMGAGIGAETFLERAFAERDVQLGVPEVDRALRVRASAPDRLRALLAPATHDDHALLQRIAHAAGDGLFICDSTIGYHLPGARPDPRRVALCLSNAAAIADELRARLPRAPRDEHLARLAADWHGFASAHGLSFDADRLALWGTVSGVAREVARASTATAPLTFVSARWPRSIEAQLAICKFGQGEEPELRSGGHRWLFQMVTNLIGQDIRIGDKLFDDAFQVMGFPEETIRAVFAASAELRAAMVQIGGVAEEVSVTDQQIGWFVRGHAAGAELGQHVTMAVRVAQSLAPALPGASPFR